MNICSHNNSLSTKIKIIISQYSGLTEEGHTYPCNICAAKDDSRKIPSIYLHKLSQQESFAVDLKKISCVDKNASKQHTRSSSGHLRNEEMTLKTFASSETKNSDLKNGHFTTTANSLLPFHEYRFRKPSTGLEMYIRRQFENPVGKENAYECSSSSSKQKSQYESIGPRVTCECLWTKTNDGKNKSKKFCMNQYNSSNILSERFCSECWKNRYSQHTKPDDISEVEELYVRKTEEGCDHPGCLCTGAVESMVKRPEYTLPIKCCEHSTSEIGRCCCRCLRPTELSLMKPPNGDWYCVDVRPDILLRAYTQDTLPTWTTKHFCYPPVTLINCPPVIHKWNKLLYSD
ncbi:hypothetical protein L9F63_014014 [Diploptera punctata]|uniref:Uncharacterized protein n=1 Tax=Diploptera punctata TaxID=6984 RepID=A0AAD8A8V2_DIPPU|nr:hypothetical protein L9F63_014014 [Diploptera punctata]